MRNYSERAEDAWRNQQIADEFDGRDEDEIEDDESMNDQDQTQPENPPAFRDGERKIIEMTCGIPEHSRFSICYWLNGKWHMDDAPGIRSVEECGYRILAIHDLPPRSGERAARKDGAK